MSTYPDYEYFLKAVFYIRYEPVVIAFDIKDYSFAVYYVSLR